MINQLTNKSRNPFNNALMIKIVEKSKFMRTDMFNKRIVTYKADRLEANARTT